MGPQELPFAQATPITERFVTVSTDMQAVFGISCFVEGDVLITWPVRVIFMMFGHMNKHGRPVQEVYSTSGAGNSWCVGRDL